jgi:hypothetical protein
MACWFYADNITANHGLMAHGQSGAAGHLFLGAYGAIAGDPVQAYSKTNAGTSSAASTTSGYSADAWQHACGIWISDSSRKAYLNGGSEGAHTSLRDPSIASHNTIALSCEANATIGYMRGVIAEAAVWSAELTLAEIALLGTGVSPSFVRPSALVAYYPMFGRQGAAGNEEAWVGGTDMVQAGSPALADHPRIIYPRRRSMIAVPSAAASTYTLSNATYVPGSLLSTGVTPRFTVTEG